MEYLMWLGTRYQVRKIADCACAWNIGNIFPARAVMHVGITNPRVAGKRSRYSWRMRNPQFYVSGKRFITVLHVCVGT